MKVLPEKPPSDPHLHHCSQERDSEKYLCQSKKKGPDFLPLPPPQLSAFYLPAAACGRKNPFIC